MNAETTERLDALRHTLHAVTPEHIRKLGLTAQDLIDFSEYVRSGRRGIPVDPREENPPQAIAAAKTQEGEMSELAAGRRY